MTLPKDPEKAAAYLKRLSEGHKGIIPSEETRKKMSAAHRGNTNCVGYKHSDATKAKMSAASKGKPKSETHKQNIARGQTGHTLPETSRQKISKHNREFYSNKENHPLFGVTPSEETKEKLRASNTKAWENPELRKIISDSNKGEKNGSYIDGRCENYEMNWRIRKSTQYKIWLRAVYRRDKYTCQITGTQGHLEAHHIKPFSAIIFENNITTYEEAMECKELWDISNGITLNKDKHKQLHSEYGYRIPTKLFPQTLSPSNSNIQSPACTAVN